MRDGPTRRTFGAGVVIFALRHYFHALRIAAAVPQQLPRLHGSGSVGQYGIGQSHGGWGGGAGGPRTKGNQRIKDLFRRLVVIA